MENLQIDGYILLKELGSGGSGTVFSAKTTRQDTLAASASDEFAVKVYSGDHARQQFLKELQHLQTVQGHPNVVQLIASCEGTPNAIVMPLYRGLDLYSLVRRSKGLPEAVAARMIKDVLAATQHVHQRGVLHRDIKPENVLVSDGKAVLIDFDVACRISDLQDPDLLRGGTAGYMSPEMILREPVGTPSDLFSVGCTLYFVFKRKPPFRTTPHSDDVVHQKTAMCKLQFDVCFDEVSTECKSLISSLVVRSPTNRLCITQALQHEWFTSVAVAAPASSAFVGRHESSAPTSSLTGTVAPACPRPHPPAPVHKEERQPERSLQTQVPESSDAQQLATPRLDASRAYRSKKPEPRRPGVDPVSHLRSSFRVRNAASLVLQQTNGS